MMGSALNYIALRILGEGPPADDDDYSAIARGRKWVLDHGGATSIPSWGKVFIAVRIRSQKSICNFFYSFRLSYKKQ